MNIQGIALTFEPSPVELTEEMLLQRFGPLIARAEEAFSEDPSYAVDMLEHGSLINYKRQLWDVRMEVTRAEKEARTRCELDAKHTPFVCTNTGVCGFGLCRFATPENALVKVDSPSSNKNVKSRPVDSESPRYRVEDAIQYRLNERKITAPARLTGGSARRRSED